jgi:hypothetical protein
MNIYAISLIFKSDSLYSMCLREGGTDNDTNYKEKRLS